MKNNRYNKKAVMTKSNSKPIAISIRQFKWSCDRRTECFRKNHVIVGRHLVCICSPQNNECSLEQTWKITCRKITSDGQRSDRTAGPAAAAAASGPACGLVERDHCVRSLFD